MIKCQTLPNIKSAIYMKTNQEVKNQPRKLKLKADQLSES